MQLAFHNDGLNGTAIYMGGMTNHDKEFDGLSHVQAVAKLVDMTKAIFLNYAEGEASLGKPWTDEQWTQVWLPLRPGLGAQFSKAVNVPEDHRIEDVPAKIPGVDLIHVTLWVAPRASRFRAE